MAFCSSTAGDSVAATSALPQLPIFSSSFQGVVYIKLKIKQNKETHHFSSKFLCKHYAFVHFCKGVNKLQRESTLLIHVEQECQQLLLIIPTQRAA